jgi:hypothetical protein
VADSLLRDRKDLADVLGAAMANAYDSLRKEQRLAFGEKLLKTYALEIDSPARSGWTDALEGVGLRVEQTADPHLLVGTDPNGIALIFDRVEDRFLLCHSLAPVRESDAAIARITDRASFDQLWLSTQRLEQVADYGALRGFTTRFDRSPFQRWVDTADEEEFSRFAREPDADHLDVVTDPDVPVQSLKLRLWGSEAGNVLSILRNQRPLTAAVAVRSVKLKYFAQAADVFALDELDYSGRATARGTSYEVHRNLMQLIVDRYSGDLTTLEQEHRVYINEVGAIHGDPAILALDGTVDVETLVSVMFGGTRPFRLAGIPRYIEDDYVAVPAVDLHGGHRIDFEVAPEMIRVYLRRGGCANTLMRVQAHLQQNLNAGIHIGGQP